ncbi:MAG: polar amino acid transport system substrate-binding protein [Gaiellaceae bacterium]|nr:polar amino acid transport system substrate-binding protein [Gaiellaceae bacterium]
MRKSILLLSVLTLLVALAAAGTAGAQRHAKAANFTYCTDPTFPPMELATTSGKITGFDVDMAAALAKTFGETAKPLKTAFPGLIPALNAKRCDAVISGIFVTPDRKKQAGVVAYMASHRVLIVKSGNPKHITSPNGLKGKVVAVQSGTKYEEYLKTLKSKIGFTLQSYPGDNDAVAQVLLGRADAVLTQDTSFAYQAGQHPGKIAIGYTFAQKDSFGIYYRKGDASSLGQQIKDGVAMLKSDGTLKKIALKYKVPVADVK